MQGSTAAPSFCGLALRFCRQLLSSFSGVGDCFGPVLGNVLVIWGRLVTDTRTVVRRPVGGWFLRPNGAQNGSKMDPKWLPGGLLERLGILKASWSGLGGLLGRPGKPFGRSWGALGGLLGALGRVLGALGAVLEAS